MSDTTVSNIKDTVILSVSYNDIQNDLSYPKVETIFSDFMKTKRMKQSGHFRNFRYLVDALEENITDISLEKGQMKMTSTKQELNYYRMRIQCGEDYTLTYSNKPTEEFQGSGSGACLMASVKVRLRMKTKHGLVFDKRVAISTLQKLDKDNAYYQQNLENIIRFDLLPRSSSSRNNLSSGTLEIKNLQSLAKVI